MKKTVWLRRVIGFATALCFGSILFGCTGRDTEPSSTGSKVSVPPSIDVSSDTEVLFPSAEMVTWAFDDTTGALTFNGTGPLSEQEAEAVDVPDYGWSALAGEVKSIVIGEGITRIPNGAFYDFEGVTEVLLPSTLKTIGKYAFFQCSFLYIELPSGLEVIEEYAFSHCQKLLSCEIPAGVTELPTGIFEECISLQTLTLYEGLLVLKEGCLRDCTRLHTLVIPSGVAEVEELNAPSLIFLVFLGDPPKLPQNAVTGTYPLGAEPLTIFYPFGNAAWQTVASQCQQDGITWIEGIPPDGA